MEGVIFGDEDYSLIYWHSSFSNDQGITFLQEKGLHVLKGCNGSAQVNVSSVVLSSIRFELGFSIMGNEKNDTSIDILRP